MFKLAVKLKHDKYNEGRERGRGRDCDVDGDGDGEGDDKNNHPSPGSGAMSVSESSVASFDFLGSVGRTDEHGNSSASSILSAEFESPEETGYGDGGGDCDHCDSDDDDHSGALAVSTDSEEDYLYDDVEAAAADQTTRRATSKKHNSAAARTGENEADHRNTILPRRKQRTVSRLRLCLAVVYICSATAIAALTYHFASNSEYAGFEAQVQEHAYEVLQSLRQSLDLTLEGMDILMVNIVREARMTNQVWPYVTVCQGAECASFGKILIFADLRESKTKHLSLFIRSYRFPTLQFRRKRFGASTRQYT